MDIRIELPLPFDIAATLLSVIGLTYPGAVIKDGSGQWRSENRLVLSIPETDRHRSPKKADKYAKVKAHLDANADAAITAVGPDGVSIGLPDYVSRLLVEMARAQFAQNPDALNYLETSVYDSQNHTRYVVICARSEQQTPHALRRQAEAERDALQAEVDRLRARLTSMGGDNV